MDFSTGRAGEGTTQSGKCNYFFFALLTKKKGFVIILHALDADIAQSVEHVIGNDEVMGPNPIISSKRHSERSAFSVFRGGSAAGSNPSVKI